MPTRKQRRRDLKAKRHDYEFVYVDADGNELDEVPEEVEKPKRERSQASPAKKQQQRGAPGGRERGAVIEHGGMADVVPQQAGDDARHELK